METSNRLYVLFPYQVLSEQDLRHLALFIASTHLLQVLEPVDFPAWGTLSHFKMMPAKLSDREAELVRRARASFQEFAAVHQDHCLMASFSAETLLRQNWESRFDIESSLRGQDRKGPDPETRKLLEAALFLEMARELDQKQADLESDLAEAAGLETEFREILGINEEDAPEDTLEAPTAPLSATRTHLSFMLSRRIANWFHLLPLALHTVEPLVLVTVNQEVIDEIVDKVEASARHRASQPDLIQVPLAAVPRLPGLSSDDFAARLGDILQTDGFLDYRGKLDALLSAPESLEGQKALEHSAEHLRQVMEATFGPTSSQTLVTQLGLTCFSNLSLAELRAAIDPGGSPSPPEWATRPAPPLLCVQEMPNGPNPLAEEG